MQISLCNLCAEKLKLDCAIESLLPVAWPDQHPILRCRFCSEVYAHSSFCIMDAGCPFCFDLDAPVKKNVIDMKVLYAETNGKAGFNVETCCVANFCPPDLCWTPRFSQSLRTFLLVRFWFSLSFCMDFEVLTRPNGRTKAHFLGLQETAYRKRRMSIAFCWNLPGDAGLMGSTPEDCCEERAWELSSDISLAFLMSRFKGKSSVRQFNIILTGFSAFDNLQRVVRSFFNFSTLQHFKAPNLDNETCWWAKSLTKRCIHFPNLSYALLTRAAMLPRTAARMMKPQFLFWEAN